MTVSIIGAGVSRSTPISLVQPPAISEPEGSALPAVVGTGTLGLLTAGPGATLTGVVGSQGIGSFSLNLSSASSLTGLAGTSAVGTFTPQDALSLTGNAGTSAVGTIKTGIQLVGNAATGTLGSLTAQINEIANPNGTGMTAGTIGSGGVLPTGWTYYNPDNLTTTIATGTDTGRTYVQFAVSGTGGVNGDWQIFFNNCAAAATHGITYNMDYKLSAGALTSIQLYHGGTYYTSVPASNGLFTTADISSTLSATWATKQITGTAPANTATGTPGITVNYANGLAINFTLRIANPQFFVV